MPVGGGVPDAPPYRIHPSPPISAVISSMRSGGNGGVQSGRMAMLMSSIGLSSAAMRLDASLPQRRQRWMMAPVSYTHLTLPTNLFV